MLQDKMILDADEYFKDIHNNHLYCKGTGPCRPGSMEEKNLESRKVLIRDFQDNANKLNYRFDLEYEGADISRVKWYYQEIWIRPINGFIQPILPRKNSRPRRNPIPVALRHEVFLRDGYRCQECGATKEEIRLEPDHIIPVSQGGTDELHNLQTLCIICNRAWRSPNISS